MEKLRPRSNQEQIQDLITKARDWRKSFERFVTGQNDEFLLTDFREDIERQMFPHLKTITKNDDEFMFCGSQIWNETVILELFIRMKYLERQIFLAVNRRKIKKSFWRWFI
jgi:hypothetical protein